MRRLATVSVWRLAAVALVCLVAVANAVNSALYNRTSNEISVEACADVTLSIDADVLKLECADSLFTPFVQQLTTKASVNIFFHRYNDVSFGKLESTYVRSLWFDVDAPSSTRVSVAIKNRGFNQLSAMTILLS
ncbi:hypothetical protein P43SY_010595 [Pythium insidiosum]|uniref:Uncharacterized protein n=1 Tax=Pythium insidiosum TaxID=114742 RepID=A0AAD5LB39_PYTIN|nr:hypothetical protein P43SY_010595 [Pythium insidiosum]